MNLPYQAPRITPFAAPRGPQALFNHYDRDSCLFASPSQTLLAHGVAACLPPRPRSQLAEQAMAFLQHAHEEGHASLLMGAIPFLAEAPAHLWVPERLELAGSGRALLVTGGPQPIHMVRGVSQPSEATYQHNVHRALLEIASARLQKVVLSRSLQIQADLDPVALVRTLAARNPQGYTYAIPLPKASAEVDNRILVGASPELLLARRGLQVISNPLAGSIPHSTDPHEDAQRAQRLLTSPKDLHEHALVVDAVAEALRPYCSHLIVPPKPSLVSTPTLWHLSSQVLGTLKDSATSSLELALALHPTPAVCGYPTEQAQQFIQQVEGFDRSYFTGLVGWCNLQGDGEWAVTIRCAEVAEQSATLYAGAGIVAGSEPALELIETAAKLRTLLSAMGLALTDEVQP